MVTEKQWKFIWWFYFLNIYFKQKLGGHYQRENVILEAVPEVDLWNEKLRSSSLVTISCETGYLKVCFSSLTDIFWEEALHIDASVDILKSVCLGFRTLIHILMTTTLVKIIAQSTWWFGVWNLQLIQNEEARLLTISRTHGSQNDWMGDFPSLQWTTYLAENFLQITSTLRVSCTWGLWDCPFVACVLCHSYFLLSWVRYILQGL